MSKKILRAILSVLLLVFFFMIIACGHWIIACIIGFCYAMWSPFDFFGERK